MQWRLNINKVWWKVTDKQQHDEQLYLALFSNKNMDYLKKYWDNLEKPMSFSDLVTSKYPKPVFLNLFSATPLWVIVLCVKPPNNKQVVWVNVLIG